MHPFPAVVVDEQGHVLGRNVRAVQLFERNADRILLVDGRLTVVDVVVDGELRHTLGCLAFSAAQKRHMIRMHKTAGGIPDWLVLEPLPKLAYISEAAARSGRQPSSGSGQACIVSFRIIDPPREFDPELLTSGLGFTLAEAELAIALANGTTLRDFAKATNRKTPTLRWHLSNALRKAECAKQSDLIRIVLMLCV
jgi:DNA-binding CsgD family transcriptional regulator